MAHNEKIHGHANVMLYYEKFFDSKSKNRMEIISSSFIDNKTIICHIKNNIDNKVMETINLIEFINMKILSIKEFIN